MPRDCAWPRSRSSRVIADSWPSSRTTWSNDSTHSCTSWGSMPNTLCRCLAPCLLAPALSIGGTRLILRPNCHAGVKNPCAIWYSADKTTWLVSGSTQPGGADSPAPKRMNSGAHPDTSSTRHGRCRRNPCADGQQYLSRSGQSCNCISRIGSQVAPASCRRFLNSRNGTEPARRRRYQTSGALDQLRPGGRAGAG